MKPNLNPEYIRYKASFITSAYYQDISEKTAGLFIINTGLNVFPKFIRYHILETANKNYLNRAVIDIKGIDDIIYDVIHEVYRLNSQ